MSGNGVTFKQLVMKNVGGVCDEMQRSGASAAYVRLVSRYGTDDEPDGMIVLVAGNKDLVSVLWDLLEAHGEDDDNVVTYGGASEEEIASSYANAVLRHMLGVDKKQPKPN